MAVKRNENTQKRAAADKDLSSHVNTTQGVIMRGNVGEMKAESAALSDEQL